MMTYLIALATTISVLYRPLILAYLLLLYMVLNGLASRAAAASFKLSIGSVNVFALDYLFGMMIILLSVGLIFGYKCSIRSARSSREVRFETVLIALFLLYQLIRFLLGYFGHVPPDSLVRMFYADVQAAYYFLPLMFVRNERQLSRLFFFIMGIALLFPVGQVLFASREDAAMLMKGQGTYRLGFGDSAIPLGVGLIAIYVWERRLWLMALPAAGIVMIAHRSAFIAIIVAIVAAAVLKGKKIKAIGAIILGGVMAGSLLFAVQHFSGELVLDSGINRIGETFEDTGTTEARLHAIPYMLEKLMESPIVGVGYKELYRIRESLSINVRASASILHPHNFALRALVQYGAIGAVLLFMAIGYSLRMARRLSRSSQTNNIGAFLFASQVYFVIFAMMNTAMGSAGFFYWILVGCTFWYIERAQTLQSIPVLEAEQLNEKRPDAILARKMRVVNKVL